VQLSSRKPKATNYNFALAKIFDAIEDCLEKSIEDFFAEFSATLEVKLTAALSFNTGIDLIAIAIMLKYSAKLYNLFVLKQYLYQKLYW
jgi:hypothetical protein